MPRRQKSKRSPLALRASKAGDAGAQRRKALASANCSAADIRKLLERAIFRLGLAKEMCKDSDTINKIECAMIDIGQAADQIRSILKLPNTDLSGASDASAPRNG